MQIFSSPSPVVRMLMLLFLQKDEITSKARLQFENCHLELGFFLYFSAKGLQCVHKSGEGLSALASEFHTSAREVPESLGSSFQEKRILVTMSFTCKALVCCSIHLSPLTDKHLLASLKI